MRVGIVGASASGIYVAMLTKRLHPEWDVAVFDHASKLGKKIFATGNGHCNLLNAAMDPSHYSNSMFVSEIIKDKPLSYWLDLLSEFGVATSRIGDLIYPITYSASSYVNALWRILEKQGVEIHLDTEVTDYRLADGAISLETSIGLFHFDRLVIATGGKSQKNLGSDGSMFETLKKHGYRITSLRPGLCPIKTKERVKSLEGVRHKAEITLTSDSKTLYSERGEALFKKDGLSGIAIFNCASIIARQNNENEYMVSLDLFPELTQGELLAVCESAKKQFGDTYLTAILEKPLAEYVMKLGGDPVKAMKNLSFHFDGLYPFEQSQVTVGGVSLTEIDGNLASKNEAGVYFVGEVVDVDGLCGGNNLAWCLWSASEVAESL